MWSARPAAPTGNPGQQRARGAHRAARARRIIAMRISTLLPRRRARLRLSAAARAAACNAVALVEVMEPRRLLATGGSIVLQGRHVEATGTDFIIENETPVGGGDDVMRIERVGFDDVRVTVNNLSRVFDMDDVDSYALRGREGPDRITKVGDIRGRVLLDGGEARREGGDDRDVITGTNATFTGAASIRDPSGREVAFWVDDERALGIRDTGGQQPITIRDDADGPT